MKKSRIILLLLVCVAILFSACSSSIQENAVTTTEEISVSTIVEASITHTTNKETTTKKETSKATTSTTSTTSTTKATTKKSSVSTTKEKATKPTKTTTTTKSTTIASDYCILTIECKEILKNMEDLKLGHEEYVPSDGYILNSYKVEYQDGDTAYDILKRGCNENKIKLTEKSTVYGAYVSGINNLDEFDCGQYSGWKYKVNSNFPGIACSKQNVNANDNITFTYVCTY